MLGAALGCLQPCQVLRPLSILAIYVAMLNIIHGVFIDGMA